MCCFAVWEILQEAVHFQNASSHTHTKLWQQPVSEMSGQVYVCFPIKMFTCLLNIQSKCLFFFAPGLSVSSAITPVMTRSTCSITSYPTPTTNLSNVKSASIQRAKRISWCPTLPLNTLVSD